MNILPTPKQWASDTRAEMARKRITATKLHQLLGKKESYTTVTRWINDGTNDITAMKRVSDVLATIKEEEY
jgi:hypothetical protein